MAKILDLSRGYFQLLHILFFQTTKSDFDKMLKMALDTPPLKFDWEKKKHEKKKEKKRK